MEKAKNDDKLKRGEDRFNPSVDFLVIVLCFIALMLFRLDLALRSIWINEIYPMMSTPVILGLIVLNAWLLIRWWKPSPLVLVAYTALFAIWGMIPSDFRDLIGGTIGMFVRVFFRVEGLAGCFLLCSIAWLLIRRRNYSLDILKGITLFVLTGTIITISAISMSTRQLLGWDQLAATSRNQQAVYHLMFQDSGSDGVYASLYECDARGFFCDRVMFQSIGYGSYGSVPSDRYDLQATEDGVVLTIDGELAYPLGDEE